MRRGKYFYVINHQNKAAAYIAALRERGWRQSVLQPQCQFILSDLDVGARRKEINVFVAQNKPAFLYPHTGRPPLQWDGMYPYHQHVKAVFGIGEAWVEVPKIYGYRGAPIIPMGWTYCKIKDFQPCDEPKNVLFAPIHVNGNGYLSERERNTNAQVFKKLLGVQNINITVRYLHKLEDNGIWREEGVKYIAAIPDQGTVEIDRADVVIAHQLMGYLSVARGKPTLFMDEGLVPISGNTDAAMKQVANWDKYKHLLMFPHDILADGDAMTLMRKACRDEKGIQAWKDRLIGEPFDGERFVDTLEAML